MASDLKGDSSTPDDALHQLAAIGAARRSMGERLMRERDPLPLGERDLDTPALRREATACTICGKTDGRHKKGMECSRCGGELLFVPFYGGPVTIAEGPLRGKTRSYCSGTCGWDGYFPAKVAIHFRRGCGTGTAGF